MSHPKREQVYATSDSHLSLDRIHSPGHCYLWKPGLVWLTQIDWVGKRYEPVILEEDRQSVHELVNLMNLDNPVVTIENRVVVGGEVRWTQWSNRMLFDQQGQFVEFQAVGRDITQLKQTEQALRESQRFVQKIADTAPALMYVYDLFEERNIYMNREKL